MVAVVTGGGGGIGVGLTRALLKRGATVCAVDVDAARLEAVSSLSARVSAHRCDVSDSDAVGRLATKISDSFGRVDLLVNNAGVAVSGLMEATPRRELERAFAVNFWGTVNCTRALLPLLRMGRQRKGESGVCNVLSDFALMALPTKAAYASSKYAARAYTEALSAELFSERIRVIAAYPGATATDFVRHGYAADADMARREARLLARGMDANSVGEAIVRAVERNRRRVLIGVDAHAIDLATRLSPVFVQHAITRFWRRVPFLGPSGNSADVG